MANVLDNHQIATVAILIGDLADTISTHIGFCDVCSTTSSGCDLLRSYIKDYNKYLEVMQNNLPYDKAWRKIHIE